MAVGGVVTLLVIRYLRRREQQEHAMGDSHAVDTPS